MTGMRELPKEAEYSAYIEEPGPALFYMNSDLANKFKAKGVTHIAGSKIVATEKIRTNA